MSKADDARIREIVERVVAEVFDAQLPGFRDELIRRVQERVQPALAAHGDGAGSAQLKAVVDALHAATTQTDVLHALIEGASAFCRRVVLFLVRGNSALGWQGYGFRDNEALKQAALDLALPLVARALQQHAGVRAPVTAFDSQFVTAHGAPSSGNCILFPLVIRDKVAALLYADAGTQPGPDVDSSGLDVLVRTAGTWLELLLLRRSATGQPPVAATQTPVAAVAAVASPSGTSAAFTLEPVAPAARSEAAVSPRVAEPASGEDELHRKARRFAKLLVDEIKLYNQAKVAEGKQNHDLYDRLKEDIDKSRSTYDKRYASSPVAAADYFTQELIRNLADNSVALLGGNFPR